MTCHAEIPLFQPGLEREFKKKRRQVASVLFLTDGFPLYHTHWGGSEFVMNQCTNLLPLGSVVYNTPALHQESRGGGSGAAPDRRQRQPARASAHHNRFGPEVAMAPCFTSFPVRWAHSPYRFMQVPRNGDFWPLSDFRWHGFTWTGSLKRLNRPLLAYIDTPH